jgi:alpha-D-ribose 1-methylphosphonate 5-triphosphate synthase subunit PhnG
MDEQFNPDQSANASRAEWMGVLARAPASSLAELINSLGELPEFNWLRQPEVGAVMTRGRAGGTGEVFSVGEMSVTRCAVTLNSSPNIVGHAYVQGRDIEKAKSAAICDALLQTHRREEILRSIINPLKDEESARHLKARRKAGATKVDFFTMVRAES